MLRQLYLPGPARLWGDSHWHCSNCILCGSQVAIASRTGGKSERSISSVIYCRTRSLSCKWTSGSTLSTRCMYPCDTIVTTVSIGQPASLLNVGETLEEILYTVTLRIQLHATKSGAPHVIKLRRQSFLVLVIGSLIKSRLEIHPFLYMQRNGSE